MARELRLYRGNRTAPRGEQQRCCCAC